jgi:hypothetical protein
MAAERPISDKPEPKLTVDLIVGLIEEQLETGISTEIPQNFRRVGWNFRVCYQVSRGVGICGCDPIALNVPHSYAVPGALRHVADAL